MAKSARLEHRRAAAAAQAARLARERRKRQVIAGSAIAAVLIALVTLIVVRVVNGPKAAPPQQSSDASSAQVVAAVTSVPAAVLNQVGVGKVDTLPSPLKGQPPLVAGGKPLVLYVGAEYCPFCAAQRWGMVVALSRFGTFTGLTTTHSAAADVYPNTPTLSFHGSTYTSPYLTFQGVETRSNVPQGNSYAPLDTLTPDQLKVVQTYNAVPYVPASSAGAIPFIDFGNAFLISGASISPGLFAGKSTTDVATALSNPADPLTQAIGGSANAFTAIICGLTKQQPSNVCTSKAATTYKGAFNEG